MYEIKYLFRKVCVRHKLGSSWHWYHQQIYGIINTKAAKRPPSCCSSQLWEEEKKKRVREEMYSSVYNSFHFDETSPSWWTCMLFSCTSLYSDNIFVCMKSNTYVKRCVLQFIQYTLLYSTHVGNFKTWPLNYKISLFRIILE